MKKYFRYILSTAFMGSLLMNTSCMDEIQPTDVATAESLSSSAKATEALVWAIPANLNLLAAYSSSYESVDWGYGSVMHVRDVMGDDMVVVPSSYDWYDYYEGNYRCGADRYNIMFIYNFYYKQVQAANNLLAAVDEETASDTQKGYLGIALAYRAMAYLDMARMYEYLPNDGTSAPSLEGLTCPIVRETITQEEARNNPRATHAEMSAFIMEDLDKAEKWISLAGLSSKTLPDLACVYGLKARLYMWDEDYTNAAAYARKAINEHGEYVMSESEWLDPATGFNTSSVNSWMWASEQTSEDDAVQTALYNWTSWVCNETSFGYAYYGPLVQIAQAYYDRLSNTDFRKKAWKAPAGSALEGQNTYANDEIGEGLPDLASLKFRPGQGNTSTYLTACATAYPLMRVEEMIFIEAEATAHNNPSEAIDLLMTFMANRDASYRTTANSKEDVIDEILFQKYIELWGEGQNFFDTKRLNRPVTRHYDGSNFDSSRNFNTTTRPAWMNICLSQTEGENNTALVDKNNPDPSDCYDPFTE